MCLIVVVAAAAVTRTTMVVEGLSAAGLLLRSSGGSRTFRRGPCTNHYRTCWKFDTTTRFSTTAAASSSTATSPPPAAASTTNNELVESKSTLPAASTTMDGSFSVLSDANLVRVITSSSRLGGVAAIRISDESSAYDDNTSTSRTSTDNDNKTADVLGKRVLFTLSDSSRVVEGIVIALRYPIAFVYLPTTASIPQRDEHDMTHHDQLQQSSQLLQQLVSETSESITHNTTKVHILNSYTKLRLPPTKNASSIGATNTANTIIDCFGNSLLPAHSPSDESTATTHVFTPIPKVSEIALINTPLLTGITMIDALTPIGRGQNMLIVGEEGTGRKSMALSAMRTQISHPKNKGAQCIYASTTTSLVPEEVEDWIATTTTKHRKNVLSRFQSYGIANQITFVSKRPSTADSSSSLNRNTQQQLNEIPNTSTIDAIIDAAESVAVASSACSIADYWARNHGHDSLVVIDSIDPHKIFWDYTTQALMDIYGQEAVDIHTTTNHSHNSTTSGSGGEMRGFFSELIQRAGRYNPTYGGGSVTLALLCTIPSDKDSITSSSTTSTTTTTTTPNTDDTPYLYQPSDFAHQPKIQSRIKALSQQNIKITSQVLKKLGIPIPPRCEKGWKRHDALRHVDDLISMTDGQIWLQSSLPHDGIKRPLYQAPFMDIRQSMTRVGIGADTNSRADAPALQPFIGGLRFTLAQAAEEEEDQVVGSSKNLLQRQRDALLLAMYTKPNTVRTLAEECICLMAVPLLLTSPLSGSSTTEEKEELMDRLIHYVYRHIPSSIIEEINETFELNPSSKEVIQSSMESFFESS